MKKLMKGKVVSTKNDVADKSVQQGSMERKGIMATGQTKPSNKPKKASASGKMIDGPYGSKSKA